jgi:glycosyltransferase involved in cell wall biosynthesis
MHEKSFGAVVLAPSPFSADPRHWAWSGFLAEKGFSVLNVEVLDQGLDARKTKGAEYQGEILSMFSNRVSSHSEVAMWSEVASLESQSLLGKFLKRRLLRQLDAVTVEIWGDNTPSVVIANDLAGAVLALARWGGSGSHIVYDAQEVFTDSYDMLDGPRLTDTERASWIKLETEVCKQVDAVVTVSPGIASLYEVRHNVHATVVPNFAPLKECKSRGAFRTELPVRFVFIGRADPNRGLEELVSRWDFPAEIATLDMIVAHSPARGRLIQLAATKRRTHSGPQFREPVEPAEMIETLSSYDIGILPYKYRYPYSHASPNKFGDYLAAGLPVLANNQEFVTEVVLSHEVGRVFDWSVDGSFESGVLGLADRALLDSLQQNVVVHTSESLNWDNRVEEFWTAFNNRCPIGVNNEGVRLSSYHLAHRATLFASLRTVLSMSVMGFVQRHGVVLAGLLRRKKRI